MGENSGIEWTDHTFNPWVGCTKVSPACDHCYAESWAKRSGRVEWGGERKRTSEHNWNQPVRWDRAARAAGIRQRVFCASLADVFDNEVPPSWRADLFRLIRATPNLDWLLLTKRIGNATPMIERALVDGHLLTSRETSYPWPNVWIGATVVTQEEADRDVPKLLQVPARGRFLSIEPMLGPMDVSRWAWPVHAHWPAFYRTPEDAIAAGAVVEYRPQGLVSAYAVFLDWVIAGGESGHGARPVHPDWIRELRTQCTRASVPFLFKQWGEWGPLQYVPDDSDVPESAIGGRVYRVGKKAAGRRLDGRTWDQLPNFEVGHEQNKQDAAGA